MVPQLGTYSGEAGNVACLPCLSGHACPAPAIAPVPCVAGTYGNGSETCPLCPSGMYCPAPVTTTPVPCAPGAYSGVGAVACTPCPVR